MNDHATRATQQMSIFAANELTLDGEWLKICPWGDFPNKVGVQRVTQRDGDNLVAAFNSLRGRLARGFLGLPVYVGHPDVDPDHYPDKRRYGKITELETRGDGLYGKVSWNDLGRAVIDQGHYLFNSPTWYLKREDKFVRPVELVSVGLTNTPQIPGDAWAKNEDQHSPTKTITPTIPMPDTLPDRLKTMLISATCSRRKAAKRTPSPPSTRSRNCRGA